MWTKEVESCTFRWSTSSWCDQVKSKENKNKNSEAYRYREKCCAVYRQCSRPSLKSNTLFLWGFKIL